MNIKTWTLFLDRDGVINERKQGGYIQNCAEFHFLPKNLSIFKNFSEFFGTILVVTNQQGIAKGLMSEEDLAEIHHYMVSEIAAAGARIDKVYHCPDFAYLKSPCRKPNTGMGLQAQIDFPHINFEKSIMVGDSDSDIEFGKRLGMKTVWIDHGEVSDKKRVEIKAAADFCFSSLADFADALDKLGIDLI